LDEILVEFKKRNISFARFLNLAFKFTLRRMKMNEKSKTNFGKSGVLYRAQHWKKPSRIGYRSTDLKIAKVWSDVASLFCRYGAPG